MAKKNLGGGVEVLFGGAEPQEQASSAQTEEKKFKVEHATAKDEEDLINSVTDAQLREALRAKRMEGRGRPRKNTDAVGRRTDGYVRTSLLLKEERVAKIKEIAFRETLTMKEIFEYVMDKVIEEYESKHGEVVPHPERYKGDVKKVFN